MHTISTMGVDASHRHGLIGTLEAHGADVRTRFGKDVTHVVVQQTHSPSSDDKAAGDAQLRGVFDKISKGQEVVQTVSMGWVQKCLECQRRVMERPYALQRPHEPILPPRKSPATAGRSAKKRRTRAGTAAASGTSKKVAEAAALDVNEPWFSSSQQLQELHNTSTAVAAPPAKQLPQDLSPRNQPRNIRVVFSDQLQQQQRPRGLTARQASASRQQQSAAACPGGASATVVPVAFQPRTLGPATQYAADILDQLPDSALQGPDFGVGLGGVSAHWRKIQPPATAEDLQRDLMHPSQQQQHEVSEDVIEDSDDDVTIITERSMPPRPASGRAAAAPGVDGNCNGTGAHGNSTEIPANTAAQQQQRNGARLQQLAAGTAVSNKLPSAAKSKTPRQPRTVSITPPAAAAAAAAVEALSTTAAPAANSAAAASAGKLSAGLSAKAALSGLGRTTSSSKRKRSSLLSRRSGLFTPPAVVLTPQEQQQQRQEMTAIKAVDAAVSPATHSLLQQQQQPGSAAVTPPIEDCSVIDLVPAIYPNTQTRKRPGAPVPGTAAGHTADAADCDRDKVELRTTPRLGRTRSTAACSPASAAAAAVRPPASSRKRPRDKSAPAAANAADSAVDTAPTPDVLRSRAAASTKTPAAAAAAAVLSTPEPQPTPAAAVAGGVDQHGGLTSSVSATGRQRRIPSRLVPWACSVCTLENAGAASTCEACGARKPKLAATELAAAAAVRSTTAAVAAAEASHEAAGAAVSAATTPLTAVQTGRRKKQQLEWTPRCVDGQAGVVAAAAAAADEVEHVSAGLANEDVMLGSRSARGRKSRSRPQRSSSQGVRALEAAAAAAGSDGKQAEQQQQQQPPAMTPRSARYLARTGGRTQQQQQLRGMQTSSSPIRTVQLQEPSPGAATVAAAGNAVVDERWSCSACTFDNGPSARKRKMCGTKRSAAAAAATAAASTAATTAAGAVREVDRMGMQSGQKSSRQRRRSTATPVQTTKAAVAAAAAGDDDQWLPPATTEDQLQLQQPQQQPVQDMQQTTPCITGRDAAAAAAPKACTADAAVVDGTNGDEGEDQVGEQHHGRCKQQQQVFGTTAAAVAAAATGSSGKESALQTVTLTDASAVIAAVGAQALTKGTPELAGLPSKARVQRRRAAAPAANKKQQQQQQQQHMPLISSTRDNCQQQQRNASKPAGALSSKSVPQKQTTLAPSSGVANASNSGHCPHVAAAAAGLRYISWTSVASSVADLAKSAVKRLPGFRLCVDGHEEGRVTHLLVGAERRTLKLLLGVANGAWLLKPDWLTDSLDKGAWQSVDQYTADIRFSPVSAAVRAALSAGTYQGPLAGKLVVVQCVAQSGGSSMSHAAAAEHKQSLQRLVRALGGRVCGARAAEVCVVSGSSPVPRELPSAAVAVREEWLLQLAETHSGAENTRDFEVAR